MIPYLENNLGRVHWWKDHISHFKGWNHAHTLEHCDAALDTGRFKEVFDLFLGHIRRNIWQHKLYVLSIERMNSLQCSILEFMAIVLPRVVIAVVIDNKPSNHKRLHPHSTELGFDLNTNVEQIMLTVVVISICLLLLPLVLSTILLLITGYWNYLKKKHYYYYTLNCSGNIDRDSNQHRFLDSSCSFL